VKTNRDSKKNISGVPAEYTDVFSRFLDGLSQAEKREIVGTAVSVRLFAGSVMTHQNQPATSVFLLTKGMARHFVTMPDRQKVLLFWLSPGDIVGGAALLQRPSTYVVSTEAIEDGAAVVWTRRAIRTLAVTYPRLLENGLSIASDYLTWYVASHLALVSSDARERVARVLAGLAAGFGRRVTGGLELKLSNMELANSANVNSFTASHLLGDWQRAGILTKRRGTIILRSPEALLETIH
jgi:CRP-like cAMP-binding protein